MLDWRTALIMRIAAWQGRTFRPDVTVAAMRLGYREMNRRLGLRPRAGVATRDLTIGEGDGALRARLYRPEGDTRVLPLLVYFHGGGFVIGDIDAYDSLTRFFAAEGALAVLAIEYRLGPEHRFPHAHEDGFTALAFAQRDAGALGIDARAIAVGGDSAGGAIAATLSAFAESRGLARPAAQLLIYPSVDGTARFPSRQRFSAANLPLTPATIGWFARHYFSAAEDASDPRMVPLDAPHPERVPPTYLLAAGHDPLVDEGRAYAQRLRNAGVRVVYDLRPRLAHGFVNMAGAVPPAARAMRDAVRTVAAWLRDEREAAA